MESVGNGSILETWP